MDEQHKVRQFMIDVKGLDLPRQPTHPADLVKALCSALMHEELTELQTAMANDDMIAVADGLADLLYVVYYTANAYGLIMQPIFNAVHDNNMTKKGGPTSPEGKQLKPANYRPVDLKPIVQAQMFQPIAYVEGSDEPVAYMNPEGRIVQGEPRT